MVTTKQKWQRLEDGTVDLAAWLSHMREHHELTQTDLIESAIQLAKERSKGLTTFYGQPYLEQGLEMAEILLAMKLDQDAIAAAITTNLVQHTQLNIETVNEKLNERVGKILQGVLQMNTLNELQTAIQKSGNQIQIDRLRKMFLAMVTDIRVVLIKLAERTCIMRGIKHISLHERKHIAQETMDIYAPLANRLGIGQLKWELEDIAFHYSHPDIYKTIAHFLAERRVDRENRIHATIAAIKEKLLDANIKAKVTGRAKHIYSIYLKKQRKGVDYKDIYDCSAVRILVPELEDCYTALSIVHSIWEHIPEEFDDYINKPKPNGYRSIHTAVRGPEDKNLEIQIRTHAMHDEAEHGVAAHWVYKENKTPQAGYEAKITFLRQLLAWHKDVAQAETDPHQQMNDLLSDRVYVFTPAGEIIDLPNGATPLDFAYHIHSEIGNRCRGAKINNHIVPLTYQLHMGDRVEIITTAQGTPSRDWLNKSSGYLTTSRARAKVMHYFKQLEETEKPAAPAPATHVHPHAPIKTATEIKPATQSESGLEIAGINDLLTRIAKCCKPIPGDDVVGYITQGRGVSIHKKNCRSITQLNNRQDSRLTPVTWNSKKPGNYYVDIQIRAFAQEHILKDVTALLANAKIRVANLNSTLNRKNNLLIIVVTVQINDMKQLEQLLSQMNQLRHIIDVTRLQK